MGLVNSVIQLDGNREGTNMIDLTGQEIVFTGRLASLSRNQAWALARACGAIPKPQPTRRTAYLIVGAIQRPLGAPLTTHKLTAPTLIHLTERDFIDWCRATLALWEKRL